MATQKEVAYATLLFTDSYLDGALVLAHSLRDTGATAPLIVLVPQTGLSELTLLALQDVYDEIVPVSLVLNPNKDTQFRADLAPTFSKILLWTLTKYHQIVYIDCDVLCLQAPNELLAMDLPENSVAGATDIGWPDCFNTGVMVLRPREDVFDKLAQLATDGHSFDGGDQGLLNIYFNRTDDMDPRGLRAPDGGQNGWIKIRFVYNCTPGKVYQYLPAYNHYGDAIRLVHFIGKEKPWDLGREGAAEKDWANHGKSYYHIMHSKWWDVYEAKVNKPAVVE